MDSRLLDYEEGGGDITDWGRIIHILKSENIPNLEEFSSILRVKRSDHG